MSNEAMTEANARQILEEMKALSERLTGAEARIADLERRMYISPELMAEIEKNSRELGAGE